MRLLWLTLALCLSAAVSNASLIDGFRPPAVPLILNDPYMSVWSTYDNLTDGWPTHWSGPVMALCGGIRIDGQVYRFMGPADNAQWQAPPMPQQSVQVFPTQTRYVFEARGVELTVTFSTPAFVEDLKQLSLPVTHIAFSVRARDNEPHNVSLYYDNSAEVAVRDVGEEVQWNRVTIAGHQSMRVGTSAQKVLGASGDGIKINWGYAYTTTPIVDDLQSTAGFADAVRGSFASGAALPAFDTRMPRACNDQWVVLAYTWNLGVVGPSTHATTRRIIFAYDDIDSMLYFGDRQRPYWTQFYATTEDMIAATSLAFTETIARCDAVDAKLIAQATQVGGGKYSTIIALAYRQVTGAMKVTWNEKLSKPWVYMKEISSDGDVSTVDVIYPAAPFLVFLAPETLRILMMPLLAYANNETNMPYNLPWSPHHLGTWPICDLPAHLQEQMPMEETGNLLIMMAAVAKLQKNVDYLKPYWPLLKTWGDYLTTTLPDPENQLCTDDFEGPSPHNVNLAIKGAIGLASYAQLLSIGNQPGAAVAMDNARRFARQIVQMASSADHLRRQYDLGASSWSLKYNLLFHPFLDLDLFNLTIFSIETSFYDAHRNPFGVPLDDRAVFTKTDWEMWVGALGNQKNFLNLVNDVYKFAHEGPDRIQFSDWYYTDSGHVRGFRARPVIGGLYSMMMLWPF